jgi:hypothetical protein
MAAEPWEFRQSKEKNLDWRTRCWRAAYWVREKIENGIARLFGEHRGA